MQENIVLFSLRSTSRFSQCTVKKNKEFYWLLKTMPHSEGERFISEFLSNIRNIFSVKIFVLRTSCQMERKFVLNLLRKMTTNKVKVLKF